jgi:hypothetical protein
VGTPIFKKSKKGKEGATSPWDTLSWGEKRKI